MKDEGLFRIRYEQGKKISRVDKNNSRKIILDVLGEVRKEAYPDVSKTRVVGANPTQKGISLLKYEVCPKRFLKKKLLKQLEEWDR